MTAYDMIQMLFLTAMSEFFFVKVVIVIIFGILGIRYLPENRKIVMLNLLLEAIVLNVLFFVDRSNHYNTNLYLWVFQIYHFGLVYLYVLFKSLKKKN